MEINFLSEQSPELYNQLMETHPVQTEEQLAALVEEFSTAQWSALAELLILWGVPHWGWRKFQDIYGDMVRAKQEKMVENVKELPTHRVHLGEKSEVSTMVKLSDCLEAVTKDQQ